MEKGKANKAQEGRCARMIGQGATINSQGNENRRVVNVMKNDGKGLTCPVVCPPQLQEREHDRQTRHTFALFPFAVVVAFALW